jgi:acetyltransferase-like isoleucine patch superfamily enzyme
LYLSGRWRDEQANRIVIARADRTLRVGKGLVIGAGLVLKRDVPPGEVWAGKPAKFIRSTEEKDQMAS